MGKTILISSHILTELADCCTSIGIIERGKLLMHGPIDEVYHRIRRNRIVRDPLPRRTMEAGLSIIRSLPETRDVQIEDDARDGRAGRRRTSRWRPCWSGWWRPACGMQSFAEKEPTLEDVFMLVTKGAVA